MEEIHFINNNDKTWNSCTIFGGSFQDVEIVACFVYLGCIDPSLHDIAELQISQHFGWNKLNVVGLNPGRITRRKGNFAWR